MRLDKRNPKAIRSGEYILITYNGMNGLSINLTLKQVKPSKTSSCWGCNKSLYKGQLCYKPINRAHETKKLCVDCVGKFLEKGGEKSDPI